MVDRITPRSTPELQSEIDSLFPEVRQPIHSEDYIQRVLEGTLAVMADLSKVGVEIVADVDPVKRRRSGF